MFVDDFEREFLSRPRVQARYADVTSVTLKRWEKERAFPRPLKVGTRCYYRVSELLAWERRMVAASQPVERPEPDELKRKRVR